jgi:hypothetical protein
MGKQRTPNVGLGVASTPDLVLLGFSSLETAPRDVQVRDDFVRVAMSEFARRRHYDRLSRVFLHSSYDDLRGLLLILHNWEFMEDDDFVMRDRGGLAREVFRCRAHENMAFVRLAELCADCLSWETESGQTFEDELRAYVAPAWPILCDEVEFEQENILHSWPPSDPSDEFWVDVRDDEDGPHDYSSSGYTARAAKRVGRSDLRRFGR